MNQENFSGLSDEELADVWYSLMSTATSEGEPFKKLMGLALHELTTRRGPTVFAFLEERSKAVGWAAGLNGQH